MTGEEGEARGREEADARAGDEAEVGPRDAAGSGAGAESEAHMRDEPEPRASAGSESHAPAEAEAHPRDEAEARALEQAQARLREALAELRRRMRVAVWVYAAAVVALAVLTPLPFLEVLALPVFFVLLPGLAIAQLPLLEVERLERIPVYVGSIVAILGLGAIGGALALRLEGVAPAHLGLLPAREMLLWTGGVTVAGLLLVALFQPLDRRAGASHSRILSDLLPRTRRERGLFAGLSLSAGWGEEMAYRGYAFQAVQLLGPGPWAAAVISSLPFGFLHAYQGPVGVVRTSAMGLLLAVPVVVTGSLLPSMAAHALLDLVLGLIVGPRLVDDGSEDDGAAGPRNDGARQDRPRPDLVPPERDR